MNAIIHAAEGRVPAAPQLNKLGTPTSQKTRAPGNAGLAALLVLAGVLVLGAIPLLAGAFRLAELASGAQITADNARFFASPLPVVLHIVTTTAYIVLGAFQFVPGLRRSKPGWHRRVGRLVIGAGLVVALSGLWMTQFYPLPAHDGALLHVFRLLFGSLMASSIALGFVAIRRRDIRGHRAWMMRGYAIGLGAGTQALTLGIGEIVFGPPDEFSRALLMGAAWVINLAVAEWAIRRKRPVPPARTASTQRISDSVVRGHAFALPADRTG